MSTEQVDALAFVDVETTGLDAGQDRIIEIAVVIMQLGATTHKGMASLVNPGVELSPFIIQYTGITQDLLAQAPGPEILNDAFDLIGDHVVAAYNVAFDAGFLVAEAHRLGRRFDNERHCVMELTMELHPQLRSYKLGDVCEAFNIQTDPPAHRALGDVKRAFDLWLALKRGRQPKPESVRAEDMAQDYAVVAYCRTDGAPFFVWRWHAEQVGTIPNNPEFDYYVRERLNGVHQSEVLGQGLCRGAADSLMSAFMSKHALTLLNRANIHRKLLYLNYDTYYEAKRKLQQAMELGRASEISDPDGALGAYEEAIRQIDTCARLQLEEGLFGEVTRDMTAQRYTAAALKAIDRISLTLCQAGRAPQAQARAQAFFEVHPEVLDSKVAQTVLRRIDKAVLRLR